MSDCSRLSKVFGDSSGLVAWEVDELTYLEITRVDPGIDGLD